KRHDLTGVSACQGASSGSILAEHFGGLRLGALAQRSPFVIDFRGAAAQCLGDDTLVQQGNRWLNVLRLNVGNAVIVNPFVPLAATRQCSSSPTKQSRNRNTGSARYPLEESGHQGFEPGERSGLFLVVVLSVDHEHAVDALHCGLQTGAAQNQFILVLGQQIRKPLHLHHVHTRLEDQGRDVGDGSVCALDRAQGALQRGVTPYTAAGVNARTRNLATGENGKSASMDTNPGAFAVRVDLVELGLTVVRAADIANDLSGSKLVFAQENQGVNPVPRLKSLRRVLVLCADVQGSPAQDAGGDQSLLDLVLQAQALFLSLNFGDLVSLGTPIAPLPSGVFSGIIANGGSEPAGAVHGDQLLGRETVGNIDGVGCLVAGCAEVRDD